MAGGKYGEGSGIGMGQPLVVVHSARVTDADINRLRYAVTACCIHHVSTPDKLPLHLPDAEVLAGDFPRPLDIRSAPQLRWIHVFGAGVDEVLTPEIRDAPILVTCAKGVHATQMAEYVVAAMVMLARCVPALMRAQFEHRWASDPTTKCGDELHAKTAVILGYGRVGQAIGNTIRSLGMRVIGVRRHLRDVECVPDGGGRVSLVDRTHLRALLQGADYLILALPLTRETHALIGESELRLMKPSAYLINVARGGVVCERDLIRGLVEGWIAGACLDVFEQEPLPADSPLYDLPNVILTPHLAGTTRHNIARHLDLLKRNLLHYLAREPLESVVDKVLGY